MSVNYSESLVGIGVAEQARIGAYPVARLEQLQRRRPVVLVRSEDGADEGFRFPANLLVSLAHRYAAVVKHAARDSITCGVLSVLLYRLFYRADSGQLMRWCWPVVHECVLLLINDGF